MEVSPTDALVRSSTERDHFKSSLMASSTTRYLSCRSCGLMSDSRRGLTSGERRMPLRVGRGASARGRAASAAALRRPRAKLAAGGGTPAGRGASPGPRHPQLSSPPSTGATPGNGRRRRPSWGEVRCGVSPSPRPVRPAPRVLTAWRLCPARSRWGTPGSPWGAAAMAGGRPGFPAGRAGGSHRPGNRRKGRKGASGGRRRPRGRGSPGWRWPRPRGERQAGREAGRDGGTETGEPALPPASRCRLRSAERRRRGPGRAGRAPRPPPRALPPAAGRGSPRARRRRH